MDGVQKFPNKPKIISSNPINLSTTADSVMIFCIIASMSIFDSFSTLLSILKQGVFVDQKSLLMQKNKSELREMLVYVDKITKLNKKQLVDLVNEKINFFDIKKFPMLREVVKRFLETDPSIEKTSVEKTNFLRYLDNENYKGRSETPLPKPLEIYSLIFTLDSHKTITFNL